MVYPEIDLLIAILTTGTGAAALITWFGNWIMKRREEYVEVSKYKIDGISKFKHHLIYQSGLYKKLHYFLREKDVDECECLYLISNILLIRQKLTRSFGGLQLADLDAEEVISDLGGKLLEEISKHFKVEDPSRMVDSSSSLKGLLLQATKTMVFPFG